MPIAFFKDQRAHQIGDLLTVQVNITDKAIIANETQSSRATKKIPASTTSSARTRRRS